MSDKCPKQQIFEKTLMEKEGKKTPQKEGLKIRHYIMNLIYRHPEESVMIPSSKELAKMFGVARSTVTLELKALVAEHYLEGKRGIGTFTRHLNFVPVCGTMPPLVGLLAGDGKYFYYPHQVWAVLTYCGLALTEQGINIRPLNLYGVGNGELSEELGNMYLSGLVWLDINPKRFPMIRSLEAKGIPVTSQIASGERDGFEGIDCCRFDLYSAGVEVGNILLREKRRTLFFLFENDMTREFLDGIRHAYRDAEIKLDCKCFFWDQPDVFAQVETELEKTVPDAVYVHGEHLATVRHILEKLKISAQTRLIAEAHAMHAEDFHGILLEFPFKELGLRMAQQMTDRLNGKSGPRQSCLNITIKQV